jgi:hypothetical protein
VLHPPRNNNGRFKRVYVTAHCSGLVTRMLGMRSGIPCRCAGINFGEPSLNYRDFEVVPNHDWSTSAGFFWCLDLVPGHIKALVTA